MEKIAKEFPELETEHIEDLQRELESFNQEARSILVRVLSGIYHLETNPNPNIVLDPGMKIFATKWDSLLNHLKKSDLIKVSPPQTVYIQNRLEPNTPVEVTTQVMSLISSQKFPMDLCRAMETINEFVGDLKKIKRGKGRSRKAKRKANIDQGIWTLYQVVSKSLTIPKNQTKHTAIKDKVINLLTSIGSRGQRGKPYSRKTIEGIVSKKAIGSDKHHFEYLDEILPDSDPQKQELLNYYRSKK